MMYRQVKRGSPLGMRKESQVQPKRLTGATTPMRCICSSTALEPKDIPRESQQVELSGIHIAASTFPHTGAVVP